MGKGLNARWKAIFKKRFEFGSEGRRRLKRKSEVSPGKFVPRKKSLKGMRDSLLGGKESCRSASSGE